VVTGDRTSVGVGRTGEELAVAYLTGRGYAILARNQRTPLGELDLICRQGGSIVVVEVKSRSSARFGEGLEAIDQLKARRLRAAAAWWLADRHVTPCPVRFDAVIVSLGGGEPRSLQHVKSIIGWGD
jgi:putative endonuclease